MRPLEIALTLTLLLPVIALMSPSRSYGIGFDIVVFLIVALALSHFILEGYRWQMALAYLVTTLLLLYVIVGYQFSTNISYFAGLVCLCFIGATILLSTILPVFELPAPTGPYKVGTQVRHLVDLNRNEQFSNNSSDPRELMIQIWYPVELSTNGHLSPYRERAATTLWNARYTLATSHSHLNAALSSAQHQYPVLIFAPSWWGQRTDDTFLAEELASHGYVVVGIDHPYSSLVVAFSDGRIVRTKLFIQETYATQSSFETFVKAAAEQIKLRVADVQFVLDALERISAYDTKSQFEGRLDTNRVGIFGYSIGGGVAAEVCWLDHRFKAGVDLDGMIAGESEERGTFAPFLFMLEGPSPLDTQHQAANPENKRESDFDDAQTSAMRRSLAKYGGYWMTVRGFAHANFSDGPFFSPLLGGSGPVDPPRAAQITRRYTLAFFDKFLKGVEEPLLGGASLEFPEVHLEAWKPEP